MDSTAPPTPAAATTSSSTSSSKRDDAIQLAVRFLKDPKVQQSTLAKRIAFLESKGLSTAEIEEALAQVNGTSTSTSSSSTSITVPTTAPSAPQQQIQQGPVPPGRPVYQPYPGGPGYAGPVPPPGYGPGPGYGYPYPGPYPPPPGQVKPYEYNWKDYTLGVIGVSAVGYGVYKFAKHYITPYLLWPTEAKLAADQKRMEDQLSKATEVLEATQTASENLKKLIEGNSDTLATALDGLKESMKDVVNADAKRDEEIKAIKVEVDSIKEMIPKMIEKSKESQASTLTELQNEVKSLKNLLLNRRMGPTPVPTIPALPSSTPQPSIPTTTNADTTTVTPASTGSPIPSASSFPIAIAPPAVSSNPTSGFVPTLPGGKPIGKPAIPAWQLAAQSSGSSSSDGAVEKTEE
ncbi:peroxisomal membrane protein pex14 [Blyttiomyces sp. JEL0837]|nr:peroxisomal membrane protein pex14 [Blyttiomyces sp. JEL0837]